MREGVGKTTLQKLFSPETFFLRCSHLQLLAEILRLFGFLFLLSSLIMISFELIKHQQKKHLKKERKENVPASTENTKQASSKS